MPIAFFSDVHSNLATRRWPDEVLERLQSESITRVIGWALLDTATGAVEFRRVDYDVERTAQAILATDLPREFAAQVRDARGYQPVEVTG